MTPEDFIAHWKDNPLTERAGAQAWFCDLCDLLGVDKPRDSENYCFERGAKKTGGGDGWADVWKRAFFGWENKKPGKDLQEALKQLLDYSLNLDNPPLLVVSDRERIIIHTTFPGYPDEPREIRIDDLIDPQQREILRWVFTDPEKLKPGKSFKAITEEAAARFAALAAKMRQREDSTPLIHRSQRVAHFLVQCLFSMFAEDERLLPENLFADILKAADSDTTKARQKLGKLFEAMRDPQGDFGIHDIPWFNGGLFQVIDIPSLEASDLSELHAAARDMDWRDIDPTIFGTLFERGLDPKTRAPLGAHYTDVETIGKLIEPVVTQPLLREWQTAKVIIQAGVGKGEKTKAYKVAQQAYQGFLLRLYEFRVLDAACGSGNFLYLGLKALRDIEKRVRVEARDLGIQDPQVMLMTGPHNILGLEINEYAAELARVTVWIGDIQWCRRNGYQHATDPILQSLDGIEHRDALLTFSPLPAGEPVLSGVEGGPGVRATEAEWPPCDVIVGNPPFLGDKMMRGQLGDTYVETLRNTYAGRVPGGADLVTYWFEKARAHIAAGQCRAAGLVATNSIRGGANRKVLDRVVDSSAIFNAWSDEPWVNEGAAVRVSLVCFGSAQHNCFGVEGRSAAPSAKPGVSPVDSGTGHDDFVPTPGRVAMEQPFAIGGPGSCTATLNGQPVAVIHADLTCAPLDGHGVNLTQAARMQGNIGACFIGGMKKGSFDIPGEIGRAWLSKAGNPNECQNSDVLKPWINGLDITRRPMDAWIIDFGVDMPISKACCYEMPFNHVAAHVKPARDAVNNPLERERWWLHARPAPDLRQAISRLPRFIGTARVAKYRLFVWINSPVVCDGQVVVIARSDDTTFGILHSRFHELWSLRMGTSLEDRPRYTPTTTFETFPFPAGLTPADIVGAQPSGRRTEPLTAGLAPGSPRWLGSHSTGVAGGEPLLNTASILPHLADPSRRPFAEAIAQAAFELNRLREAWLNPPDWVEWVITPEEEQAGFPPRPVAKPGHEADLKKRTLTNLYNARPAWLAMAHEKLDRAVAAAYGWEDYTPDMPDEEILKRLLALNQARAAKP